MNPYLIGKYGDRIATTQIEVKVAASGRCYFPDDAILREKRIVALELPRNIDNANAPSQRPLIADATVGTSYLTLKNVNDEVISQHPLQCFLISETDRSIRLLDFCGFNPQKSYIDIVKATAIDTNQSFVLQFYYVNQR